MTPEYRLQTCLDGLSGPVYAPRLQVGHVQETSYLVLLQHSILLNPYND